MKRQSKTTTKRRSRAWIGFIGALLVGAGGWLLASHLSGRIEAWDGPEYFWVYLSFVPLVGGLSLAWPTHVWRWPLALVIGQGVAFGFHNPTAIPLPAPLLYLCIISSPLLLPALAAVRFHNWRNRNHPAWTPANKNRDQ